MASAWASNLIDLRRMAKDQKSWLFVKALKQIVISYGDLLTDVGTIWHFFSIGERLKGTVLASVLAFSFVVQAVVSFLFGQDCLSVAAGLLGMKPIIDTVRDLNSSPPPKEQKLPNDVMLFFTRMIEVVTESIPQSFLQMVFFLTTYNKETNTAAFIQIASLAFSIFATGSMIVMADRDFDISPVQRSNMQNLCGYTASEL